MQLSNLVPPPQLRFKHCNEEKSSPKNKVDISSKTSIYFLFRQGSISNDVKACSTLKEMCNNYKSTVVEFGLQINENHIRNEITETYNVIMEMFTVLGNRVILNNRV